GGVCPFAGQWLPLSAATSAVFASGCRSLEGSVSISRSLRRVPPGTPGSSSRCRCCRGKGIRHFFCLCRLLLPPGRHPSPLTTAVLLLTPPNHLIYADNAARKPELRRSATRAPRQA